MGDILRCHPYGVLACGTDFLQRYRPAGAKNALPKNLNWLLDGERFNLSWTLDVVKSAVTKEENTTLDIFGNPNI